MKKAYLDYETFFDDDTSAVTQGTPKYIVDPNSYAYIVSVAAEGEDAECGTLAEMAPRIEQMLGDPTLEWWAANSNFDEGWTRELFGTAGERPWECALDLSCFHQMPRNLSGFVKASLGEDMDKSIRDKMRGVHYAELPEDKQLELQEYCLGDVTRMARAIDAVPPMSSLEAKIARWTRMTNTRGVLIDTDLVKQDLQRLEEAKHSSFMKIPWRNQAKPGSPKALAEFCIANNIPVPSSRAKTDAECSALMKEHPKLDEVIRNLRTHGKCGTMREKIESLLLRVMDDGTLPMDLFYCGAPHTRRWSSRGFNIQNLEKEPTDLDGYKIYPRHWIKPRPGKTFLILDYAQAEPRCLNWIAGNYELLEAMRMGYSYYEAYARAARGWSGAPGTIKKELQGKQYTLLKNECLGCGYGMGWKRFKEYAAERGAIVSDDEAKAVVVGFRKNNPKVVNLWGEMDGIIRKGLCHAEKHFRVEMPTGDFLNYFHLRSAKGSAVGYVIKTDFGRQSIQSRLWGGTLTENLCQRMSRDIMAERILECEEDGIPVLFTVHDELVLEVDKDNKEEAKQHAREILSKSPDWAPEMPLAVDGGFAEYYTKLD